MQTTMDREIKAGVDLARVRAAVTPVLVAHGVALVDLQWLTDRAGWTLRLTIERDGPERDRADGGVTLADCTEVSRDVSSVLDVEDLIAQHYHLEVSSPGLDRPLRTAEEFARFVGRLVRVKLSRPAPDGQRLLRGTLETAEAGRVRVVVDHKPIEAALADVAEANLVFELAPQPKKGAPRSGRGNKRSRSQKRRARTSGSNVRRCRGTGRPHSGVGSK